MNLTKTHIKLIQSELNKMNLNAGTVDGLVGDNTKNALLKVPGNTATWPFNRQAIAFIQYVCKKNGCDPGTIDGFWGGATEAAYNDYTYFLENGEKPKPWRDEETIFSPDSHPNPNQWPIENTPEFDQFYGKKGEGNLVRLQFPYPMRLSWKPYNIARSVMCHKKVKDSLNRVLTNVLNHYGIDDIKRLRLDVYGGCYNDRPIRGGTRPSTHSWGIALDFDPDNNPLYRRDSERATFKNSEYDKWWQFWEDEGWVSLGRTLGYDWMHVQAARRS